MLEFRHLHILLSHDGIRNSRTQVHYRIFYFHGASCAQGYHRAKNRINSNEGIRILPPPFSALKTPKANIIIPRFNALLPRKLAKI